jgi:hypothetical protein
LGIEKIIKRLIATAEIPDTLGFLEWLKSQLFWIDRVNNIGTLFFLQ